MFCMKMLQFLFLLGILSAKFTVQAGSEFAIIPQPRVTAIPTNLTDTDGTAVWKWPISEDESRRLTAMFGQEFNDLNIAGTYINTPIMQCPKCGKDNEFIDWVYTALEKGFHTPEFIYGALKDRRFPKESKHDIYCSRCGALTNLRRRPGTPPEVPKVNKKLLWLQQEQEAFERRQAALSIEKDGVLL